MLLQCWYMIVLMVLQRPLDFITVSSTVRKSSEWVSGIFWIWPPLSVSVKTEPSTKSDNVLNTVQ